MRPKDKTVFLEAARLFQAWILVRRTNPASLEYIGLRGYTPKPIDCKAKTADIPHRLAGLVIDPRIHSKAFDASKRDDALRAWAAMQPLLGRKYTVDEDMESEHYGCLMLKGCYIHGDYDLYDVVDILQPPRRNLALVTTLDGQPHTRAPRFYALQDFINAKLGTPMIQHSGNAQYAAHPERPMIDVFGPKGEFTTISNRLALDDWYQNKFQGRKTLAESHW